MGGGVNKVTHHDLLDDYINIALYSIKIRLTTPYIFTTLATWLRRSGDPHNRILSIDNALPVKFLFNAVRPKKKCPGTAFTIVS